MPIDYTVPVGSKVTVEPRNIGAGHAIVFQFNSTISSTGIVSAIDTISGTIADVLAIPAGSEIIVTLPGVPDKRRVTVSLTNVNGAGVNATATIGFLVGDVNSTGVVNASDIAGVKARSLQSANTDNFKFDLDTSGTINATDVSATKARSGRVLP